MVGRGKELWAWGAEDGSCMEIFSVAINGENQAWREKGWAGRWAPQDSLYQSIGKGWIPNEEHQRGV